MKTPLLVCTSCGGRNFRRSRRTSLFDLLRMAAGQYPFRCLDCNQRVWASVWLFSKLLYAKCPKCLGMQLTGWDHKHYHHTFWWNLRATFGAHRYRCPRCRCNFLSFRPSASPISKEPAAALQNPERE
ncbi:MAG TPA: hypothetical protein VF283_01275 [Bryobacteraceae bacterium]